MIKREIRIALINLECINNRIIRHCAENHPEVRVKKCELCDYVTIGAKYLGMHRYVPIRIIEISLI